MNTEEARDRAEWLEHMGYLVEYTSPVEPDLIRETVNAPPDVILIDLSRLPSQSHYFTLFHGQDLVDSCIQMERQVKRDRL